MEAARDVVRENLEAAQRKQKTWYDKRAREVQLDVRDQVLVLLPTRNEKLLTKWKGPYLVVERVGKVNYKIEIPGATKKQKLMHINMLKKWHPPDPVFYHKEVDHPEEELDVEWRNLNSAATLAVGAKLSPQQSRQLEDLLESYQLLLDDKPGCTQVLEHTIPLNDPCPIRQAPYRIPVACREEVEAEILEMLKHGVIEPTTSPWASLIVTVSKKDGTVRMCGLPSTQLCDSYGHISVAPN